MSSMDRPDLLQRWDEHFRDLISSGALDQQWGEREMTNCLLKAHWASVST